ncbi:MAG: hypothetical protein M1826_000209 [Phylliscum demangeonii]|nr:MAG: hypothetical protein M1826_000209 [Phylliscum demangeonii]
MSPSPSPTTKSASRPLASASVILVSPRNQVLLLHRVATSTSFASAHVFPGGHVAPDQDGRLPGAHEWVYHDDGPAYRLAAIRECFEESGVLLARRREGHGPLAIGDDERARARIAIHDNKLRFVDWLAEQGAVPDTDGLIPFTRWLTPVDLPRRFTTQMYLYFMPLLPRSSVSAAQESDGSFRLPTTDGGIEHTTARYRHAHTWLSLARKGSVILFPPQFLLLHLLAPFLAADDGGDAGPRRRPLSRADLAGQRRAVVDFVHSGTPPWREKCFSPYPLPVRREDGRLVFALEKPAPELDGSGRRGDDERVLFVTLTKGVPSGLEVGWKADVLSLKQDPPPSAKL